jgi:uncharacterized Zn-finger protein
MYHTQFLCHNSVLRNDANHIFVVNADKLTLEGLIAEGAYAHPHTPLVQPVFEAEMLRREMGATFIHHRFQLPRRIIELRGAMDKSPEQHYQCIDKPGDKKRQACGYCNILYGKSK